MKLLKTIKDKNLSENFRTREASRAVLFDRDNLIPLLFVSKYNYHKLPGGGLEGKENKIQALTREIKEEAGCVAKIGKEIGKVIEYRSEFNLKQTSYGYLGKVLTRGEQDFTKKEKKEGFELIWVSLDEAIKMVKKDKPTNYEGKFIKRRDLAFLIEAKKSDNS